MSRGFFKAISVSGLLLLAACGATPAAQPTQPSAAVPAAATIAAAPTPTMAGLALLAGIPQGTTPEGYHTLGDPQAPVTIINYSDFL